MQNFKGLMVFLGLALLSANASAENAPIIDCSVLASEVESGVTSERHFSISIEQNSFTTIMPVEGRATKIRLLFLRDEEILFMFVSNVDSHKLLAYSEGAFNREGRTALAFDQGPNHEKRFYLECKISR